MKTIGKHINNDLKEKLEDELATVANFATVQQEGDRTVIRQIAFYDLDVIISVGYRVKSTRGVEFRKWANQVLKEYIVRGYAINHNRMNRLNEVIRIMKCTQNQLEAKQVLSVVEKYSTALELLDAYDHQNMSRPKGNKAIHELTYEECINLIKVGALIMIVHCLETDVAKGLADEVGNNLYALTNQNTVKGDNIKQRMKDSLQYLNQVYFIDKSIIDILEVLFQQMDNG